MNSDLASPVFPHELCDDITSNGSSWKALQVALPVNLGSSRNHAFSIRVYPEGPTQGSIIAWAYLRCVFFRMSICLG